MQDIADTPYMEPVVSMLTSKLSEMLLREGRVTPMLLARMDDVVATTRLLLLSRAIVLPPLAVLPLPSAKTVEFVRKDWPRKSVEVAVKNILIRRPDVNLSELATAVRVEFPEIRTIR